MQQIIAGAVLGAAAIIIGPRLISSIAGGLRPVGEGILNLGEAAVGTVTSSVSAAGNWVSGWVGSGSETAHTSSPARSQKAKSHQTEKKEESFLQEAEEFGKEVAVSLAEEEAISFIKMALLAII